MAAGEQTVDDLNSETCDTVFLSLPAESKTAVDINISAEHNRLQKPW
jgi:hypothetical protein